MYFCPKCNYTFDVSKNISSSDKRKEVPDIELLFKLIKKEKDLNNYMVKGFTIEDVVKHKSYKKLSDEIKQSIEGLFTSVGSGISFKCTNCNYVDNIVKSIRLYQLNLNNSMTSTETLEDNMLISKNPILPRTRDYECKNRNCITHKDKSNKEAVFYKDPSSYNVKYICCVCYNSWN
jgi:hypothetical protein